MTRVIWQSWSPEWGAYEISRLHSVGVYWVDGWKTEPASDDIWLSGNGTDHRPCARACAAYYAENDVYIPATYRDFPRDNRWDQRFVVNSDLLQYRNTHLVPLGGYWAQDGKPAYTGARPYVFGMALTRRQPRNEFDNMPIREEFVEKLRKENFAYWGRGWSTDDPNYRGVSYTGAFDYHPETRDLLCQCKFALVLDTTKVDGYVTEKFWHALAAGCIPVYSGPATIKSIVWPEVFIYVDDFESVEDVIGYCGQMRDASYRKRVQLGRDYFLQDTAHSWESVYGEINSILVRS
jgi:hypothetical protein